MDRSLLKDMMVALNFPLHFIHICMSYISSTSYVLMINGYSAEPIKAKRGLREGDLLSPLLFVFGMKFLSCILKSREGNYGFHSRCRMLKFTHLCFADDLMLFCKGDISSASVLHQ